MAISLAFYLMHLKRNTTSTAAASPLPKKKAHRESMSPRMSSRRVVSTTHRRNRQEATAKKWQNPFQVDTSHWNVHQAARQIQARKRTAIRNDRTGPSYKISGTITEDDVRKAYPDIDGDSLVVLIRLAVHLLGSNGMSTVENEEYLRGVSDALKLPPITHLLLSVENEISLQFHLGRVLHIPLDGTNSDDDDDDDDYYHLSLLNQAQQLAQAIIQESSGSAAKTKKATIDNDAQDNIALVQQTLQKRITTKSALPVHEETALTRDFPGATALAKTYSTGDLSPSPTMVPTNMPPPLETQQQSPPQASSLFAPHSCLLILDDMQQQSSLKHPYSRALHWISIYVVSTFAPVTVYLGGYHNLAYSSIIAAVMVIELVGMQFLQISAIWELPLLSFTTGFLSPILWQASREYFGVEQCAAQSTIGVLLIWFPGSSLVYGAHEVMWGSYYNGAARLIKAIISAMSIALFYTVGWQYWGRNWASDDTMNNLPTQLYNTTGPIASLPPSVFCEYEFLPWYMNAVVFAIPLNAATMVLFHIRLRDCVGVFGVAQATYLLQGVLQGVMNYPLPNYVMVLVLAFFAGIFAELNEIVTNFSKHGTILCVIFVLAPGAGAVRAVLGAFHRTEGDFQSNVNTLWESVVFEGVTYAVGFLLAFGVMSPLVPPLRKLKEWACCVGKGGKNNN